MDKLKTTPKYEDYKKKKAAVMKKCRKNKKKSEENISQQALAEIVQKRREATRERVQKCRERKRLAKLNKMNISNKESTVLSDMNSSGYSSTKSLGKAVCKATRALPVSPSKKKAVLARIMSKMNDEDKQELVSVFARKKKYVPNKILIDAIRKFYERDDVSRVSPKIRDVKEYLCPTTGDKILLPKRHMTLTVKEAFAIFDEEQRSAGRGI